MTVSSTVDSQLLQLLISPARSITAVFSIDLKLTVVVTTMIQAVVGVAFASRSSSFVSGIGLFANSYIFTSILLIMLSYIVRSLVNA